MAVSRRELSHQHEFRKVLESNDTSDARVVIDTPFVASSISTAQVTTPSKESAG